MSRLLSGAAGSVSDSAQGQHRKLEKAQSDQPELFPLLSEITRGINSNGCVNGQTLESILDAALTIAEKRRESLGGLLQALKANNAAALKASAKELCGLDDEKTSDRIDSSKHARTSGRRPGQHSRPAHGQRANRTCSQSSDS